MCLSCTANKSPSDMTKCPVGCEGWYCKRNRDCASHHLSNCTSVKQVRNEFGVSSVNEDHAPTTVYVLMGKDDNVVYATIDPLELNALSRNVEIYDWWTAVTTIRLVHAANVPIANALVESINTLMTQQGV
jgi:hypothetical protein